MDKINVLQIGEENWKDKFEIPEYMNWFYQETFTKRDGKRYDMVFLDRNIRPEEVEPLFWAVKANCLFVTEQIQLTEETDYIIHSRKGRRIAEAGIEDFLYGAARNFYRNSVKEKGYLSDLGIAQGFEGKICWHGKYNVEVEGNYGSDYKQVVFWRNNISIREMESLDLWLEYEKDAQVSVQLQVKQYSRGADAKLQQQWIISENQMQEVICLQNTLSAGVLYVSLAASGNGKLVIKNLHCRASRCGFGHFLPGGERFVTKKREEIFCYFDPGDLKPPLNVYFADYKEHEGFEGYHRMRDMGSPFLLISESRLGGGAFYLGDEEYQQIVKGIIQKYMDELGFRSEDVVFSGISMGAFGAIYYACDFMPHAIMAGKPLVNIGDVAANERLQRPDGFPLSLEILKLHTGLLDEKMVTVLNQLFWKKFENAFWGKTHFILAYMYEDDYDAQAYKDILSHLNSGGVKVLGKGIHGRNRDNTKEILKWFDSQYQKLLVRDYGREIIR